MEGSTKAMTGEEAVIANSTPRQLDESAPVSVTQPGNRVESVAGSDTETAKEVFTESIGLYQAGRLQDGAARALPMETKVRTGPSGSRILEFRNEEVPAHMEYLATLSRVTAVYRSIIERGDRARHAGDRRSVHVRVRKAAVLAEKNVDATAVAFIYGLTTETVKRMRKESGLDPETGRSFADDVVGGI